ncbi:MAG: hypothetical protein AB1758_26725, partial [Candidatus Eremiobacterota bacterium]
MSELAALIYRNGQAVRQVVSPLPPVPTADGTLVWQEDSVVLLDGQGTVEREVPVPEGCDPSSMLPCADTVLLLEEDRLTAVGSVSREIPVEPGARVAALGEGGAAVVSGRELLVLGPDLTELAR